MSQGLGTEQAKPITSSKIQLAKEEEIYANKSQGIVDDVTDWREVQKIKAKMGWNTFGRKVDTLDLEEAKRNYYHSLREYDVKLSNQLGINIEDLYNEEYALDVERQKKSESMKVFADKLEKAENKYKDLQQRMNESKNEYLKLENESLKIIDGMNDKAMAGSAQMVGNLVEGFSDVSNIAAGVAMNYMSGTIAGAYGLNKLGTWALENTMDFVENYHTMKTESEMLDRELTQEELIEGAVTSLVMQNGINFAKQAMPSVNLKLKENMAKIVDNAFKYVKDKIPMTISAKEISKNAYDAFNPNRPTANQQLFEQKMELGENYKPELDPNNYRNNIMDRIFDHQLDAGEMVRYKKVGDGVVAIDFNTDKIDNIKTSFELEQINSDEYTTIRTQELYNLEHKIDIGMDIDNGIDLPKGLESTKTQTTPSEDINIYNSNIPKEAPIKPTIKNDESVNKLLNEGRIGDFVEIVEDTTTSIAFKNQNDDIVKITINNEQVKDRYKFSDAITRTKEENDYFYAPGDTRVEIYTKDGKFINVSGNKKNEYINYYKQLQTKEGIISNVIDMSERYQQLKNEQGGTAYKGMVNTAIRDLTDTLIYKESNISNSIYSKKSQLFRQYLGKYYNRITDFTDDVNVNALVEIIVKGDTDLPIVKNINADVNGIKSGVQSFVKHCVDTDKLVNALERKEGLQLFFFADENAKLLYSKIFNVDENGIVQYNTKPDGYWYGKDIEKSILDMSMNLNTIDIGDYQKYGFLDRDVFNFLIGDELTTDRLNGMAIEVFYRNSTNKLEVLKKLGAITFDEENNMIVSPQNFMLAINNIYKELNNKQSIYNKNILKEILQDFRENLDEKNNLPKKIVINEDGTRETQSVTLYDYILKNKSNGLVSNKDIHNAMIDTLDGLQDVITNYVDEISIKNQTLSLSEQQRYAGTQASKKAMSILNKWSKVFTGAKNQANAYMETKMFAEEKAQLRKQIQSINAMQKGLIDENILDTLEPVKYTGDIDTNKLYDYIQNISKKTSIDNDIIHKTFDTVNDFANNNKSIKNNTEYVNRYENNNIKQQLLEGYNAIKNYLSKEQSIELQKLIDDTVSKSNLRKIAKYFKDVYQTLDKPLLAIKDYNVDNLDGVIAKTRYRERLLNNLKSFGKIDDNIIEYIDYTSKRYDYKIPKIKMKSDIDDLINIVQGFKNEVEVKDYGNRKIAYNQLSKKYKQLRNVIRENIGENSTAFFTSKDITKLVDEIKELRKTLNIKDNKLDDIYNEIQSYKDIIADINNTKKNSTLRNAPQSFVEKYKKISNDDRLELGRLESAINKNMWLQDKHWFFKTDKETPYIVLETSKISDITQTPKGTFEKYIKPEYQEKFKILYDYAVKQFKQVEEYDDNGNLISSRPMTLDEFTIIYSRFLEDLTKTTKINKIVDKMLYSYDNNTSGSISIGALQSYFNNKNDMIHFFANRIGEYGHSYVKNGVELLYNYMEKNASKVAQYSTYGMSGVGFSKTLNVNNRLVQRLLDKYRVVDVLGDVEHKKPMLTLYNDVLASMSKKIENYYTASSRETYFKGRESNLFTKANYAIDIVQPFLLMGSGSVESLFNGLRSFNRVLDIDGEFHTIGLGSGNKNFAYALNVIRQTKTGLVAGVTSASTISLQSHLYAMNLLGLVGRYVGLDKAINKTFGTNYKFETDIYKSINPIAMAIRKNPQKKAMYRALLDFFESKELMRRRDRVGTDISLAQEQYDPKYKRKAYAHEAYSMYQEAGYNGQQLADMWNGKVAIETVYKQMEDISKTSYDKLPENFKGKLKKVGIVENNYTLFLNTLNSFKNQDGDFYDINLRNITSDISPDKWLNKDRTMIDSIESFATNLFQQAFDQNKDLKYEANPNHPVERMQTFLKRMTLGIGISDITNFFYRKTQRGTIEAIKFGEKLNTLGYTAIPNLIGYTMLAGSAGLVGAIAKNIWNVKRETALILGEIQSTLDIINSDEDNGDKFFEFIGNFFSVFANNIGENMPLTSIFMPNNMANVFIQPLQETQKQLLYMVGLENLPNNPTMANYLQRMGIDIEEDISTNRFENLMSIINTVAIQKLLKTPYNTYKGLLRSDYDKVMEDYKWLEKNKRFATNSKIKYHQLNNIKKVFKTIDIFNKLESEGKYTKEQLGKITVPLPPFELMNKESQIKYGMMLYDNLYNSRKQFFNGTMNTSNQMDYGLNELVHNEKGMTEKEYQDNQLRIFKDMDLDKKISQLNAVDRYTIKKIEKANSHLSELDMLELKNAMLTAISQGMSTKDIEYNFMPKETNIKEEPKKIISFKELPAVDKYKLLKQLKEEGYNIKELISSEIDIPINNNQDIQSLKLFLNNPK